MNRLSNLLAAALLSSVALTGSASAQTARDIRGPSPYEQTQNEPAPRLIVDPPLAEALKIGVFQSQYRTENIRITPVFGPDALAVLPRVGHLHVIVDDLPWWWADASDNNTVDVAGLPPGKHKVTIQLVNANHEVIQDQTKVLEFTVPPYSGSHH